MENNKGGSDFSSGLVEKWKEYTLYLSDHGEEPSYYSGYFNFYWFMVWLEWGRLPGKKFAPKKEDTHSELTTPN